MIGVPSVRKWRASSLPLEPKSEPWLKGTTLNYWTKPGRRHAVDHNTGCSAANTPDKQDFWCDSKQVAQNRLNLNRSDPLTGTYKGRLFVSNIHQSLEDSTQKAIRAVFEPFGYVITGPPTPPVGFPCVWALVSLHSPAARTRSR